MQHEIIVAMNRLNRTTTIKELASELNADPKLVSRALVTLKRYGFVIRKEKINKLGYWESQFTLTDEVNLNEN